MKQGAGPAVGALPEEALLVLPQSRTVSRLASESNGGIAATSGTFEVVAEFSVQDGSRVQAACLAAWTCGSGFRRLRLDGWLGCRLRFWGGVRIEG